MGMIVYTGGTFDLFHSAHVRFLKACRRLAGSDGAVVVALNTDAFIQAYKGSAPIMSFDERFHPIYFEDNDYERRLEQAGVKANFIYATLRHDNSSTLNSGFHSQNDLTYGRNHKLFQKKIEDKDFSEGAWSLQVRRANSWE